MDGLTFCQSVFASVFAVQPFEPKLRFSQTILNSAPRCRALNHASPLHHGYKLIQIRWRRSRQSACQLIGIYLPRVLKQYVHNNKAIHTTSVHMTQRVWTCTFLQRPAIVKQRFHKRYRHPDLDSKLTTSRFKQARINYLIFT